MNGMDGMNCETVRDILPEHVRGELDGTANAAVEAHLAHCTACGTEAALVVLLARTRPVAPAGLEARIVGAVRTPKPRRVMWIPSRAAMAAAAAGVLLTGGLLLRQAGEPASAVPQVSLVEEAVLHGALTWMAEPLLSGGPALHELSLDELEALLMELES
jgi:anti-sigma factor RsiW